MNQPKRFPRTSRLMCRPTGFASASGSAFTNFSIRLRCCCPLGALRAVACFFLEEPDAFTAWNRTRYTFAPLPCLAIFNRSTTPLNPDSRASSGVISDHSIAWTESISISPTPVLS
ncbi:MAG TPA: hypothetical protein VFV88_08640 [Steroidobacteraceae bacterium]|nr:hypothetical protein [Steroidobacteraceae bacterium]